MSNHKILKVIIITILIIILIISAILISLYTNQRENEVEELEVKLQEITRVKNRNDFFTVSNCIDRYITYLTTKEKEILYGYLDESYKIENNVTVDNVYSFVKTLDDYYKFKAREMYVIDLSDSLSQYFVYGTLTIQSTGDDEKETDFYISVKLDKANGTFSIIPDKYIEGLNVK